MSGVQIISWLTMLPVIGLALLMVIIRSKYKNRSNARAFFFKDGNLVLNTGLPYPIAIDAIDYVELRYSSWELEHKLSYGLIVKVVKKSGKTKRVFYKGYRTAKLVLPSDMIAALEENGIRCVVVDK